MEPVRVLGGAVVAVVLAGGLAVSASSTSLLAQVPSVDIAGTYVGRYVCRRAIGMQLVLETATPGRVSGVFTFFERGATAANPTGAFRVSGTFDPQTHELQLQPREWIKQAPERTPVALSGTYDPDRGTIRGKVAFAGCTSFEVRREGFKPRSFQERLADQQAKADADRRRGLDPERLKQIEERVRREEEQRKAAPPFVQRPPQELKTSIITKLFETESGAARARSGMPPLDTSAYRRGDMLGPIYDGRFEFATAGGLDNVRYFAQTIGDLAARCKNLDLEATRFQVLPYVAAAAKDLIDRLKSFKASESEYFQAAWLMMLQLNSQWSCQYDPAVTSRNQAQARCDAASNAVSELGVFQSVDAATDITLFLGRYGCDSGETRHLVRQLGEFARIAHTQVQFTSAMPPPMSPAGRAYARMFENCARQRGDNAMDGWCGCYVRTVHGLNPPAAVLEDLSRNPFVDGTTYMRWVAGNLKGGGAVYDCSRRHSTEGRLMQPRTTACLVDRHPGTGACTYRAAWGEFTMTRDACEPELNSRDWGYREVECAVGARAVTTKAAPRVWNDGRWRYIDYEGDVAETFVPDLPADAGSDVLTVRFLTRRAPGTLRAMGLTGNVFGILRIQPRQLQLIEPDIQAVENERARLLTCSYNSERDTQWVDYYWFEKLPSHVSEGRLSKAVSPHPFTQIQGVATKCPAKRQTK